ncbi:MAG: aminotransferase class V-fold PLP-dependent enzyme [Eubacterium sp.]|nr:aminotransferase class V-fold PLP-dependent enzyme [Eubacterium sp.]
MVYLNQAATTYPKPQEVIKAVSDSITTIPQGQFRSSSASEDIFASCKDRLGELFGVKDTNNINFAAGATAGANALFYGLDFTDKKVVVTATEHNSILRPAMNLLGEDRVIIAPCNSMGQVDAAALEDILMREDEVAAVFINHCSNVTGYIQDMKTMAYLCHKYDKYVFADFSQSAGCIPIDVEDWEVDGFIFAGHKGLYGIQGIGGYYVRPGIELRPFMYGGTGRDSRQLIYDEDYEYEVGTGATPAVAGLEAGVKYVLDKGVASIREHEMLLMQRLYSGLDMAGVSLHRVPFENRGPVLSLNVDGMKPSDVAYILQNGYDITVRTGLHCAPLIHRAMGTYPFGTVRISVSDFNNEEDVECLIDALEDIVNGMNYGDNRG